jgi:carnitine O-acetyltransferase
MDYKSENEVKASFGEVYHANTPHAYFKEMRRLHYEIGERAKPYFSAAAELLRRQLGLVKKLRVLDLGCSYGVGAALLKYDFTFAELADFFAQQAPRDYEECVEETRELVQSNGSQPWVECVGADASREAIRFAADAELIQSGIAKNLEEADELTPREAAILRRCHLMTSTGAIGYVGPKTLGPVLSRLGKDLELTHGPYIVVTILRMFDPQAIAEEFARAGYEFVRVPGIRLRQRHFDGAQELRETVGLLEERGIDPEGWETEGHLYADLFAGAPESDLANLIRCLQHVHVELHAEQPSVAVG